jgi:small-conductance mechanosensitive channel
MTDLMVKPLAGGPPCTLQVMGGQLVGSDDKAVTAIPLQGGAGTCAVTLVHGAPPPVAIDPGYNNLVFAALVVLLVLATVLGAAIVFGMIRDLTKTLDKLAQLLSEENSSKTSLSRVQALIFTYVVAFGSLLIIARTGQFPSEIPVSLAILTGGSLATYLMSKGIQKATERTPT